jgi:hypothetical protein
MEFMLSELKAHTADAAEGEARGRTIGRAQLTSCRQELSRSTQHSTLRNDDTMKPLSGPAVSLTRHCQRPVAPLTKASASTPRSRGLPTAQRRGYQQDVQITRTGKPIISIQGGRYVLIIRCVFSELIKSPDPPLVVNSIPVHTSVNLLTPSKDTPQLFSALLASLGDT